MGEQTRTGAQIKVEDSEDSELEEEEEKEDLERANPEPQMETPGQRRDDGYKNCMKSVFKNIAEAQQSETKTDDISITFDESPVEGRPAREIQYKVEAEAAEETEPVSPEKMRDLNASAFTMSETQLGRPEGFQAKLFLLLGPQSVTQRVASEVVTNTSLQSLQSLHIDTLVQKNIKSVEFLPI